jgi:hypothetical protein
MRLCLLFALACAPADKGAGDTGSVEPERPSVLGVEGEAVTWTPILTADDRLSDPRDLGFDTDGNLWVANREDDRTFIVLDPGTDVQAVDRRKDGYALHFMEEVAALSFEDASGAGPYGGEFGSCGESENTYNDSSRPNNFMGPVLWTTNLDVFAKENPEGLGSHLDMQHESPLCVGIAWEKDNVYWVFDGHSGTLVRNDFQADHDVGMDDHSDGVVYRYAEPTLTRVEGAPGHMVFDHTSGMLYIADTGAGRILRVDTTTGQMGEPLRSQMERIELYAMWEGAAWEEVATGFDRPGGLALDGDRLIVGEWGTGLLHELDLDGTLRQTLDTGVGSKALFGIEIGPDGRLWITETATPSVLRLDVACTDC